MTPTSFECYMHEFGVDTGQHGLPKMHVGLKLDFAAQRDGSMLISRMYLDVEYIRQNRRSSIASKPLNQELTLAGEL